MLYGATIRCLFVRKVGLGRLMFRANFRWGTCWPKFLIRLAGPSDPIILDGDASCYAKSKPSWNGYPQILVEEHETKGRKTAVV